MTSLQQVGRVCLVLGVTASIPTATFGQGQDSIGARSLVYGGPSAGAPVLNAPFSADATVTFTRTLDDGSRTEQHAKARYYRDSAGRVRAEWVDIGLGGQDRTAGRYTSIWVTPGDGWVYAMDLLDQTFRFFGSGFPATEMFHGRRRVVLPLGADTYQVFFNSRDRGTVNDVPLGERQIEGVNTMGRRLTEPMQGTEDAEMVEERWESTELQIVIYSRLSDVRAGASVDYRLTNITRTEPPPQLFVVPPDRIKSGDGVYSDDGRRRWLVQVRPSPR